MAAACRGRSACLLLAVASVLGCGGSKYQIVPVAGVVTLDGQPLEGAKLVFSPVGSAENPYPGPRSTATTDAEGRFRLTTSEGQGGAVIGSHRVRVSTLRESVDPENPLRIIKSTAERVPREYRSGGRLDTTVPDGGVEDLQFDLVSNPS